jgi:hypothetical protein
MFYDTLWFKHAQERFLHAECDFDTYEYDYDTHKCDYDTRNTMRCDFNMNQLKLT